MSSEQDEKSHEAISVGPVKIPTSGIRAALASLFSGVRARARIDDVMSERIAKKLAAETSGFSPEERFFIARFYGRSLKRFQNSEDTIARAEEIFPDMERQMKALPPPSGGQRPNSEDFFARVLRDAEDISDESVRDLYARVLAGEVVRPGSFSMKTLSVLRDLERDTAQVFEKATKLIISDGYLPTWTEADDLYKKIGIDFADLLALQEADLLLDAQVPGHLRCNSLEHHGHPFRLRFTRGGFKSHDISDCVAFPAIALTRAGCELAMLPGRRLDLQLMRRLAEYVLDCMDLVNAEVLKAAELRAPGREILVTWCEDDKDGIERDFEPPVRRSY